METSVCKQIERDRAHKVLVIADVAHYNVDQSGNSDKPHDRLDFTLLVPASR